MGEIADLILEGVYCQCCGAVMDDLIVKDSKFLKEGPGYPRNCSNCEGDLDD